MARERAAKRARPSYRAGDAPPAGSSSASTALASAGQAVAAALSPVATAIAAGGSPFDALPDELVTRIIAKASEWSYFELGSIPKYAVSHRCTDQDVFELVQLSLVSRRFRGLALQPSLWERIFIEPVSDEVVEAFLNQPKQRREALRSLFLGEGDFSDGFFAKLCKSGSVGKQLTSLIITFKGAVSPGVVPSIRHFSNLQQLCIQAVSDDWLKENITMVSGPIVQGALQALASLPLQALALIDVPMTLETLQALASLAPTLKRLDCGVIVEGTSTLLPVDVCSSIAAFPKLEQLRMVFHDKDGSKFFPRASEANLQTLSSLSSLRVYAFMVNHMHVGFLSGMRQLEYVSLSMEDAADISALLPLAGSLRHAVLTRQDLDEAASASFAAAAALSLSALENLTLLLPSRTYSALAQLSVKRWTNLKSLTVECMEDVSTEVPSAFLKRLASDVPSLRELTVKSPLPFSSAKGVVAVGSLETLRRLVIEGDAVSALDKDARRALQASLLNSQIVFEDSNE